MIAWLRRMLQARRRADPVVRDQEARVQAQAETVRETVNRAHSVSARILDARLNDYRAQDGFRRGRA